MVGSIVTSINVAAIAGSLRKGSFNRAALVAASELAPDGMEIVIHGLDDIPFYDADLEREHGYPEPVSALREVVSNADALLLATPEYNGSTTGVLKNALDWLSRGGPDSALRGKPTATMGAGGRFGSLRAQLHLREILASSGSELVGGQVMIDAAPTRFDDDLRLTEERYRSQIAKMLEGLAVRVHTLR